MKKVLSVFLTLLALTATAYADAIVSPVDAAFSFGTLLWPVVLVVALVAVTVVLIRRFWKK